MNPLLRNLTSAPRLKLSSSHSGELSTSNFVYPTIADKPRFFRESVLGSTEQQLAVRATQVGFWARINSVLLDGPNGRQVRSSRCI